MNYQAHGSTVEPGGVMKISDGYGGCIMVDRNGISELITLLQAFQEEQKALDAYCQWATDFNVGRAALVGVNGERLQKVDGTLYIFESEET